LTHALHDKSFKDLTPGQDWAAKKCGWSEKTWNENTYVPPSFAAREVTFTVPDTAVAGPIHSSLMIMMGNPDTHAFSNGGHLSRSFLATRILRYSTATYART
jgi:hypothetical protein